VKRFHCDEIITILPEYSTIVKDRNIPWNATGKSTVRFFGIFFDAFDKNPICFCQFLVIVYQ